MTKYFIFMLSTLMTFASINLFAHHLDPKTISHRTAPVGHVYRPGDKIAQPQPVVVASASGPRTGESIFNSTCSACHRTGAAGAPKFGNAKDWAPRAAKGIKTLLADATKGLNAMPPKGMCMDCSANELQSAIQYMLDHSK